jgi:hypothetical protein
LEQLGRKLPAYHIAAAGKTFHREQLLGAGFEDII